MQKDFVQPVFSMKVEYTARIVVPFRRSLRDLIKVLDTRLPVLDIVAEEVFED